MECNKEEAIRAKTIAEKKFADKDFAGAKKFTLKSQNLYPGLDGISQMLITLDVYIASETKVNGESDWYGVLDVKPFDDDETIRKQYRKLVLMLHPDKNKSVGADGAFKILSEAWKLLSDKSTRSAYNQRRKFHHVLPQSMRSSQSSPTFVNVIHRAASKPKGRNSATTTQTSKARVPPRVPPRARAQTQAKAQSPVVNGKDTFWTICHGCKMHYEYYKVYLNQTLLCRSCQNAFHAVEMSPANMPKPGGLHNKTNIPSFRPEVQPGGLHNKTNIPLFRPDVQPDGFDNKTNIPSFRPEVHFEMPPSGASKAESFGVKVDMDRTCDEFNAQRLSKRRKD